MDAIHKALVSCHDNSFVNMEIKHNSIAETFIASSVKLLFFTGRHWREDFLLTSLMLLLNNRVITFSFLWHSSYKETLVTQLVTRSLCNGSCSQELHYSFYSTREKASQHNYMSQMESLIPEILVQERDFMT